MIQTVFEILNKRTVWESFVRDYKLPKDRYQGTINNLQWFITYGHKSNSLRKGFVTAQNLAKEIVSEVNLK